MTLIIERIPQLPPRTIPSGILKLVVYDPVSDVTSRMNLADILSAHGQTDYQWNSTITYETDDVVLYQDNFWVSLQDSNTNNIPQENSFWHVVSKAANGLATWQAGVYSDTDTFVVYDFDGTKAALELVDSTRPFNSSDLIAELNAGKWKFIDSGDESLTALDTTTNPIVVDMKNLPKRFFKGSAVISGAATWTTANLQKAIKWDVKFTITTVGDQIMPANFLMPNFAPWDASTRKWTPPGSGKYIARFTWDGAEGTIEINGAF